MSQPDVILDASVKDVEEIVKQKEEIIKLLLNLINEKISPEDFKNHIIFNKMNSKVKKPYSNVSDRIFNNKKDLDSAALKIRELENKTAADLLEINKLNEAIRKANLNIDQLSSRNKDLEDNNKSIQVQVDNLTNIKNELELKNQKLENKTAADLLEINKLNEAIRKANLNIDQLSSRNKDLEDNNKSIQVQVDNLTNIKNELELKNQKLENRIAADLLEINKLDEDIRKANLEIKQLKSRNSELDNNTKLIQSQVNVLEQTKSDLELKINELISENNNNTLQISKLVEDNIKLVNSKIESERNKNNEIDSLNQKLNTISNSLDKQIYNFKKSLNEINEKILHQQVSGSVKQFLKEQLIKKYEEERKEYLVINWNILQEFFNNLSVKIIINNSLFKKTYQSHEDIKKRLLNIIIEYYQKEINKTISSAENLYNKI